MKRIIVALVTACMCLTATLVCADQYLVVKDKSGKCKVEVFRAEKGSIIAGPFASREEGMKALQEKCPGAAKKPAPKTPDKK